MSTKESTDHHDFLSEADELWAQGERGEALVKCLCGVDSEPNAHQGQLLLARMLFELGCNRLCVRELQELNQKLPDSKVLRRLLEKFGMQPSSLQFTESTPETVAEADFDLDELEMMANEEE